MIEFIVEEDGDTRRVKLDAVPVHIGRGEEADIPVTNDRASRHHARVQLDGRDLVLMDLDSSNGTYLNKERVRRMRLSRGDRIEIGDAVLTYVGGDAPIPPTAAPIPEIPGYTVLDEQGEGVLSHVLMARQDALGRKVAIKVLREEWRGSKAIVTRFKRQARQQSRLHHHGLASGIDIGEIDDIPFYVLEYLEGDTLGARVRSSLALDPDSALPILRELLETVAFVHEQGQCVENLQPEGVVLGDQGEVWLTSIGFPLPATRGIPDGFASELLYLAPEAINEPADAGPRGDVFAFGALAAFLLTGRPPRAAVADTAAAIAAAGEAPPRDLLDGRKLPPALKQWILRLLSAEPADRPADGGAALLEFEALVSDLDKGHAKLMRPGQGGEGVVTDGPSSFRRNKKFILLNRVITVCLGVALNVGFFVWWTGRDDEPDKEKPEIGRSGSVEKDEGGGGGGAAIDDSVASEEFSRLASTTRKLVARDRFSEAVVVAGEFVDRHAGSTWSQEAVALLTSIQKRRLERAGEILDQLEAQTASGDLVVARETLRKARPLASDVASDRLKSLEARLHDAWVEKKRADAAKGRVRPAGGDSKPVATGGAAEGTGGTPTPTVPKPGPPNPKPPRNARFAPENWPKLVERALTKPSQQDLRTKILEMAAAADPDQLGKLVPRLRWLKAVDLGIEDLRVAWRAQIGQEVQIKTIGRVEIAGHAMPAGKSLKGRLEAVHPDRLVVQVADAVVDVSLDRVAPGAMARMLTVLPPNLDRYLARAGLHLAARDGENAWFDLQGVLLLATDDAPARSVAEAELERLRRAPPRRRKK